MYQRHKRSWTKHLDFMLLDLLCMHFSFLMAYKLRHGPLGNPYGSDLYLGILLCMSMGNIVAVLGFNTYKNVLKRGWLNEFRITLCQVAFVILLTNSYLVLVKESTASRFVVFFSGILYFGISYFTRSLWKDYLRKRMKNSKNRSLLIVTNTDRAENVIGRMTDIGYNQYYVVGLVLLDDKTNQDAMEDRDEICGVRIVADKKSTAEYVCREWIDEVLIDVPRLEDAPHDLMEKIMAMGVVVHISLNSVFNPYNQNQFVERMGGMTVLTSSIRCVDSNSMILKRAMDIVIGLIGTLMCAVLTVIVGPVIFIKSPGPIFFKQIRVGKNGRRFTMYKFRSMYMDAEARKGELLEQNNIKDGMMFKLDYDPRIIGCRKLPDGTVKKGIGNFIRDWSIDEFPQFINILKGEMSAVGTRPPTVDEWEKYELHHRQRLAIKPGLTGLWQVSGRSNITDFEEVVKLDAQYITNWSLTEDIRILFKTVGIVVRREGAK